MSGRGIGIRGPSSGTSIAVVILDRPSVVRSGISLVIAAEPDLEVTAETPSPEEALAIVGRMRGAGPVVVLVSLAIGGEHDALWVIRAFREMFPFVRVLCCGTRGEAVSVSRALLVGADGYLDKETDASRFVEALRRCSSGETVLEGLPENALGAIADAMDRQTGEGDTLSERQRNVLVLAAEGLTARQIATRLGLRERTVTTHLDHIYRRLGVSGRVAAITEGARLGLVAVGQG